MSELKKCPFCGGKAELVCIADDIGAELVCIADDIGYVKCATCGIESVFDSEAATIAAWNRRADEWIPVTEQEPPDSGVYLVCEKRLGVRVAYEDEWRAIDWQVTHWMPLPEPPKGE